MVSPAIIRIALMRCFVAISHYGNTAGIGLTKGSFRIDLTSCEMADIYQEIEILDNMDPKIDSDDRIIVRLTGKPNHAGAPSEMYSSFAQGAQYRVAQRPSFIVCEISAVEVTMTGDE